MYYQRRENNVLPQTQNEITQKTGQSSSASRTKLLGRKKSMQFLAVLVLVQCLYTSFMTPTERRTEASNFSQMDSSVPLELLQAIQANNVQEKASSASLSSSNDRGLLDQEVEDKLQRSDVSENLVFTERNAMQRTDGENGVSPLDAMGMSSDFQNQESNGRGMKATKREVETLGEDIEEEQEEEDAIELEGDNDTNSTDTEEEDGYEDDPEEEDAPEEEEKDGEEGVHRIMSKLFKPKSTDAGEEEMENDAEFEAFMKEKDQEAVYDITKLTTTSNSNPRDLSFLSDPINEQVNVGESLRGLNFAYPDGDEPSREDEPSSSRMDEDEDDERDQMGREEPGERGGRGGDDEEDIDSPYHLHNLNLDPESLQKMDSETLNKIMEVNNINPDVLPKFAVDVPAGMQGSVGDNGGGRQSNEDNFQSGMRGSEGDNSDRQFDGNNFQGEMRERDDNNGSNPFSDKFQGEMRAGDGERDRQFNENNFQGEMRADGGDTRGNQFNENNLQGEMSTNGGDNLGSQFGGGLGSQFNLDNLKAEMRTSDSSGGSSGGPSASTSFDDCGKPWIPAPRQEPVTPTMNASYPGSGARLSWKLIRAITGRMTSDDAVDDGEIARQGLAISIKTHYPAHGSNDELFKPFANVERSVLLVRNPANAIPSFLSYLYERNNNLANHSTRAPLEYWIEWRDKNFENELQSWVEHTLFWLEHNSKENLLVVAYEHLIHQDTGPNELMRIGNFISQTSGIPLPQKPDDIPCVWDYVVNSRGDKQPQSHRTGGPKRWPYTDRQIEMIISYLSSLGKMYPELSYITDEYIVDALAIQAATRNMSP